MHIKNIFAKLYGNFALATPLYKYTHKDTHRYMRHKYRYRYKCTFMKVVKKSK